MFTKNTYLFPHQVPPNSLHSRASTSVLDLEMSINCHDRHHDVLSGHYLSEAANSPMFNQNSVAGGDPLAMVNTCPTRRATKKDRHSKICTSQGPRDRRVRLSIGIARKFFDLQEMLGFDKPSKTLDWLLTKSKAAIKDLMAQQTKQNGAVKSTSSPSECEDDSSGEAFESYQNVNLGLDSTGKSIFLNSDKQKGTKDSSQMASVDQLKESRVKARARARERTREKLCIKQINETRNKDCDFPMHYMNNQVNDLCDFPMHYMNNQLNDFCKISGSSSSSSSSLKMNPGFLQFSPNSGAGSEAIVIKRWAKNIPIWGFQQNLMNSRDLMSPNCSIPFPDHNSTENWDVSGFTPSQHNISVILNQHDFINSSTPDN